MNLQFSPFSPSTPRRLRQALLPVVICLSSLSTALLSPAVRADQPVSALQPPREADHIVWRTSSNDFAAQIDLASEDEFATPRPTEGRQDNRLFVFPVREAPAPNEAVLTIAEQEYEKGVLPLSLQRKATSVLAQQPATPGNLSVSTQAHAATVPSLRYDGTGKLTRDVSAESYISSLGRLPTRVELKEFRLARNKPTTPGIWITSNNEEDQFARFASASQYQMILAEGLWMSAQGRDGRRAAWRGLAATAVTGALTVAVKKTWRRRRPYPNDQKFGTFPSGHTSTVFAMATVMAQTYPHNRWFAYSAASAVGWSRIKVRAHHPHDVLAGALLGYAVGKAFSPKEKARESAPLASIKIGF